MKALIQRVISARVEVDGRTVGKIGKGILLFLAVEKDDNHQRAEKMLDKILAYRIFADEQGKLNFSLNQTGDELLVVSQFTLAADTQKGLRPSFSSAAPPSVAEEIYNYFVRQATEKHGKVSTGKFAAYMQVSLQNDGPLTFLLEG